LGTCGLFWQCDELAAMGATVGETPADVVAKCKYTIAMLSDPSAALSVKRRCRHPFLFLF
jgi:glyoxylate/succinic semialdehyde reductase